MNKRTKVSRMSILWDGRIVETWYNRHERAWVTQKKDQRGNQIGDAFYDGTRKGALQSHTEAVIEMLQN